MCSILLQAGLASNHSEIEALYDKNVGDTLTVDGVVDTLTKFLKSITNVLNIRDPRILFQKFRVDRFSFKPKKLKAVATTATALHTGHFMDLRE